VTSDAFVGLAIFYLAVYMPVCGEITCTENVFEMKGIAQTVYKKLGDIGDTPTRLFDEGFSLFPDNKSVKVEKKLAEVLSKVSSTDGAVKPEAVTMIRAIGHAITAELHHDTARVAG
jgi:hypothetical protein